MNNISKYGVAIVGTLALSATTAAAQDRSYDDEMLCRFFLDGVQDRKGADPEAIANNTDVGGYYWNSAYDGEEYSDGGTLPVERMQWWLYPWTVYPDEARQPKGVAVRFLPDWDAGGRVIWRADSAYPVGFEPSTVGMVSECAWKYPTDTVVRSDVTPLKWSTPDCEWSRAHTENSPHPAPPGCR